MAANFRVVTTPEESQNIITQTTPTNPTSSTSNAGGGGNFESTDGYPVINRVITPNYKDFNLKSASSDIEVEIQGSGRDFQNIYIKESVDKNLGTISDLYVVIEDPIRLIKRAVYALNVTSQLKNSNNFNKIINEMNENYTIYDNDLYIKVPRLIAGENVKYGYKVRSNKSGIFNVVTRFRLNGSRWSDLEKRDTIKMSPPEIDVNAETDQSYAICDQFLNITYDIFYKSDGSDELGVKLFFNNSDQFTIYYENGTQYTNLPVNLKLKPLERSKYPIKVKYHFPEKHTFPNLDIVGANVYQKDADIDVISTYSEGFLADHALAISFVAILFSFCVLIFDAYRFWKLEMEVKQIHARHWRRRLRGDKKAARGPRQSR